VSPAQSGEPLKRLSTALGYEFRDPGLLTRALTHRSAGSGNYERLEFLGDGALNFVIGEALFQARPDCEEGDLSRLRASLVREDSLAAIAERLELGEALILGGGVRKSGGFRRHSILADAFEALLGAVYLDGGFEAARAVVLHLLGDKLESAGSKPVDKDPKTALQELLQGRGLALPRYAVQKTEGEAHDQTFIVECRVDDLGVAASGRGTSRRAAEQAAAEAVLALLEKSPKKKSKEGRLP